MAAGRETLLRVHANMGLDTARRQPKRPVRLSHTMSARSTSRLFGCAEATRSVCMLDTPIMAEGPWGARKPPLITSASTRSATQRVRAASCLIGAMWSRGAGMAPELPWAHARRVSVLSADASRSVHPKLQDIHGTRHYSGGCYTEVAGHFGPQCHLHTSERLADPQVSGGRYEGDRVGGFETHLALST